MKEDRLKKEFFHRPVLEVAEDLLGHQLVLSQPNRTQAFQITEVEAYDGPDDKACHGRFGMTKRTEVMFGEAGYWYVYLCYGMYWMLNIVTGDPGYPAAVLIRAVEGYDGPGKLTKHLGITGELNGKKCLKESGVWIERGEDIDPDAIRRLPRIGIDYAEEWKDKPYRFLIEG